MSVVIEKSSDSRGGYVLRAECTLPRPIDEIYPFFADAYQLEKITPPWLRFRVLTPRPIEMRAGQIIDYQLRLHGIPIGWKTEISAWEPPYRFVDEALKSPYRFWHHEHIFEPRDDETLVHDIVHYDVPGGRLIHKFFVKGEVEKIFRFRQEKLKEIFSRSAANQLSVAGY